METFTKARKHLKVQPRWKKNPAKAAVAHFKHKKYNLYCYVKWYSTVLQANPHSYTLQEWIYMKSKWSQRLVNKSWEQSLMELGFPDIHSNQTSKSKPKRTKEIKLKEVTKPESYDLTNSNTSILHSWLLYKIHFSESSTAAQGTIFQGQHWKTH